MTLNQIFKKRFNPTINKKFKAIKKSKNTFQIFAIFILSFSLTFCSKDNQEPSFPPDPANLTDFFNTLPTWETFSPQLAQADVALGNPVENDERTDIEGKKYNCFLLLIL